MLSTPSNLNFWPNSLIRRQIINSKTWRSEKGQLDKIEIEAKKKAAQAAFLHVPKTAG